MANFDLVNLTAYLVQGTIVVAAATAAHAALRLHAPAVSYAYWRAVLAACLLAPLLLVRYEPASAALGEAVASAGASWNPSSVSRAGANTAPAVDPLRVVTWVIACGVAVRLVWLLASFSRLGERRRSGRPAGVDDTCEEIQRVLGTRADIRLVPDLAMPVTFGVWRPVVLLPASIGEHPEPVRRAIVAHELLHVQRRDWLWHVVEEVICALFWFHPAVWWAASRIQLSREATVDELAVLVTGKRRVYLEALIAFADDGSTAPATAFARRRHLFLRIQSLSREAVMSSTRVVLSSSVLAVVLVGGVYTAASAFPITADAAPQQAGPGPLEQRASAVGGEHRLPTRTNYESPEYPVAARSIGASGSVTMRVTLDELGRVAEMRRTGFGFTLTNPEARGDFSGARAADVEALLQKQFTPEQASKVMEAVDAFTAAAERALRQWRYEPPAKGPLWFDVTMTFKADGETMAMERAGSTSSTGRVSASANMKMPEPMRSASGQAPVRVGGNIKTPIKIRDVRPVYPPEAQAARVSGMVIIEALIGVDGSVEQARVLRSIPLLDQAALDAVQQWRFTPTRLNDQAVPVIMTVTVNFTIQ